MTDGFFIFNEFLPILLADVQNRMEIKPGACKITECYGVTPLSCSYQFQYPDK